MMKSKKITIVDITADDNAVIKNDDVETVEEITVRGGLQPPPLTAHERAPLSPCQLK